MGWEGGSAEVEVESVFVECVCSRGSLRSVREAYGW